MLEETIPILDLGPYLVGTPGADRALADKMIACRPNRSGADDSGRTFAGYGA